MKKLGKKLNKSENTIEAYWTICGCPYAWPSSCSNNTGMMVNLYYNNSRDMNR